MPAIRSSECKYCLFLRVQRGVPRKGRPLFYAWEITTGLNLYVFSVFITCQEGTMSDLFIKNMVCNRCIMVVQNEMEKLGIPVKNITLGEVQLEQDITAEQKEKIHEVLLPLGFELIDNRKGRIIEKIKHVIIDLVHNQDYENRGNLSDLLARELHHDYHYLSNLFSDVEGTTIEKYLIAQKIERVKELLVYDELSLSEIAQRLNYSSVAYLSNQFKKVTGLTPSHFKQVKANKRKPLDEVGGGKRR